VAIDGCKFYRGCMVHFRARVSPNVVAYVHLLPWFPVLDVFLLIEGKWVKVAGGQFDYCSDYEWVLIWFLGDEGDS
jgi:hypothetical protein